MTFNDKYPNDEFNEYTIAIDFPKGGNGSLAIKRIDIKEFREIGFLQEANRLFFHPLGLALEVSVNEDGSEFISGVWDSRDDEEGIAYDDDLLKSEVARTKADNVKRLRKSKSVSRKTALGYITQPIR
jgi:hypothetical protein